MPDNTNDTPETYTIDPQTLADFASKIDGIEYTVIVSDEGFPLAFTGIDKSKAETAAALAVDLVLASSETIMELIVGKSGNEVIVDTGEGKVIDVAKAKNMITLVMGQRNAAESVTQRFKDALTGRHIKCPYCGEDLTLQTYKCPKCGKTYPFVSPTCPHCGAIEKIKKCPHCGRLISWNGKPIKEVTDPVMARLALLEGVLGGVMVAMGAMALTSNPLAVVGGGVLGGILTGALIYKAAPKKYIVEGE
ncbi:MAG: roadblock/LC7 domain-containing protein [Desulfurococcales archaeon]|nr:roadblock/LC7 domain-containing protein [Desulfurococcales archaeon]